MFSTELTVMISIIHLWILFMSTLANMPHMIIICSLIHTRIIC